MSDIQQSKSILAKLLATENVTVEHRSVPTASFDVNNRVLTLPIWEGTSNDVYDLLVGHEVGHALFTPNLIGSDINLPQGYLNVIEDARIEKLMKRKYPGLARAFYRGYNELHDKDFFELKNIDINNLKFIDRINLYFKLGSVNSGVFINFTPEEKIIVNKVSNAETFDDVVNIVKELVDYTEQQIQLSMQESSGDCNQIEGELQENSSEDSDSNESSVTQTTTQSSADVDGEKSDTEEQSKPQSGSNTDNQPDFTSDTDNAWSKNQQQFVNINNNTYIYLIPPEFSDIDKRVITWKEFAIDLPNIFTQIISNANTSGYNNKEYFRKMLTTAENAYKKYKEDSKKSVSYLIKEFEMKKRATEYNRSSTAATGILDTNKMHSYKWNDDIFKKVTVVPQGKSHGLIMHIDWSGSMQDNLVGTIKQLFNLIQFCKKVQIPFEVYSFNDRNISRNYAKISRTTKTKLQDNQIYIHDDFHLVNFLSSKMNVTQLETQMKNIWKLATLLQHRVYLTYDYTHYDLGGTPLNECIFASIPLFQKFKNIHKVDKVNTVFLTDGESNSVCYNRPHMPGGPKNITHAGWNSRNDIICIQDKKNKITMVDIAKKKGSIGITAGLIDYYRQVTGSNAVGFRLIDSYAARAFLLNYMKDEYRSWNDVATEWSKTKSFISTSLGYNELYFISVEDISSSTPDTTTQVSTDAATAFKSEMSKKAFNKIILSKFVEQIA